jgi:hypothetical protein
VKQHSSFLSTKVTKKMKYVNMVLFLGPDSQHFIFFVIYKYAN